MTERMTNLLARRFIERATALKMKPGTKRDDAALEFFCGAWSALEDSNHAEAQSVGVAISLVVSVRGYLGIAQLAGLLPGLKKSENDGLDEIEGLAQDTIDRIQVDPK